MDRQLSGVGFLDIYDSHIGAAAFAANCITNVHVFIRHRFPPFFKDAAGRFAYGMPNV